jgi:predicted RNA-binding Zn-ribbon protein involved in translation (DUF1610 family)
MLVATCAGCSGQLFLADPSIGFTCPRCGTRTPPRDVSPKQVLNEDQAQAEFRRTWKELRQLVSPPTSEGARPK